MKRLFTAFLLTASFFAHADYYQGSFGNILVKFDDKKATMIQSETWHCKVNENETEHHRQSFGSVQDVFVYDCPIQEGLKIKLGFNKKLGQTQLTVMNNGRVAWNDVEDFSVLESVKGDFQ